MNLQVEPEKIYSKPKFRSEVVAEKYLETKSVEITPEEEPPLFKQTNSQYEYGELSAEEEAYDNLMSQWKNRQRQSFTKEVYTYDPQSTDFSVYKKPVSEERNQIFTKYSREICSYLNAKFIIQEIIQPIKKQKKLNLSILKNLEFIYLLSFRAWCQINSAIQTFNERKVKSSIQKAKKQQNSHINRSLFQKVQFNFTSEDMNLKYLVDPMIKLQGKVDQCFSNYHRELTKKEKEFRNLLLSFFKSIFRKNQKVIHDKFLCGFEGIDFKRQEQIDYTINNYLDVISSINSEKIKDKIYIMKKIINKQFQKMEGYDDYEIQKVKLLKQLKQNQNKN